MGGGRFSWALTGTVIIAAVGVTAAGVAGPDGRVIVLVLAAVGIGLVWLSFARAHRVVRDAEVRLRRAHGGAGLVERVNLWMLPSGRAGKLPPHFVTVDPMQVAFRRMDGSAILSIPVAQIDLLETLTAAGDRTGDKAVTILFGDPQQTVQFFTVTYIGSDLLEQRVRTAAELPAAP